MVKKKWAMAVTLLIGLVLAWPLAASTLIIKLRFIAGSSTEEGTKSGIVTSYFLKPLFTGNIMTDFKPEKEMEELKRVFHLSGITLLTEADLTWDSSQSKNVFQAVQINGTEFIMQLTPNPNENEAQFRVEVFERKEGSLQNLLDTELILPYSQGAVLGFQDPEKKPYFISFHVEGGVMGGTQSGWEQGYDGGIVSGVAGVGEGGSINYVERLPVGIKEISSKQLPRLVHMVKPIYFGLASSVEGSVIVEAVIDTDGHVKNAGVISASHPLLASSALTAIKQWIYEPYRENDKAIPVKFRVTVNFALVDVPRSERLSRLVSETFFPEKTIEGTKIPLLIKKTEPTYPLAAFKARIQGVVIFEVAIDEQGKVTKTRVVSGHPILNNAANDAVKQWVYQPYFEKGRPVPVQFSVNVPFILEGLKEVALPMTQAGKGLIPDKGEKKANGSKFNLVHKVTPIYPPIALKASLQGMVVLEALVDAQGNIAEIKVISGHPMLTRAAVNAVKQWKYEPYMVYGKQTPVTVTVTVSFTLASTSDQPKK